MSPLCAPLILALLGAADAGPAIEPLGFQSRVVPSAVKLGEPFVYELTVTHLPTERYELVRPKDLGDFEMAQVQRSRVDAPDGKAVTTFQVGMSLFALGIKTLPEMPFEIFDGQTTHRWMAPGIDVEGLSSLPPDAEEQGAELKDIRPPEAVPVRSYRLLWWLAGLLAAAGLGYLGYRYWKNRKAAPIPVAPPLPLGQRMRTALESLAAEDLPGQGRGQEFYFRLSELLRGYLGERYSFEARECTTYELVDRLRRLPTPGLPVDEVIRFTDESDLVKFAKAEASHDQCKQALAFAYSVLERTWPPPPPPTLPSPPAHGPGTGVQ